MAQTEAVTVRRQVVVDTPIEHAFSVRHFHHQNNRVIGLT